HGTPREVAHDGQEADRPSAEGGWAYLRVLVGVELDDEFIRAGEVGRAGTHRAFKSLLAGRGGRARGHVREPRDERDSDERDGDEDNAARLVALLPATLEGRHRDDVRPRARSARRGRFVGN